jgi:hypothetical protein
VEEEGIGITVVGALIIASVIVAAVLLICHLHRKNMQGPEQSQP